MNLREEYEKEKHKTIEYHREGAMSYHHCIEYIDWLEKKLNGAAQKIYDKLTYVWENESGSGRYEDGFSDAMKVVKEEIMKLKESRE